MKRFTAIDGRRCVAKVTEEQQAENDLIMIASILTPPVMILIFSLAAGLF